MDTIEFRDRFREEAIKALGLKCEWVESARGKHEELLQSLDRYLLDKALERPGVVLVEETKNAGVQVVAEKAANFWSAAVKPSLSSKLQNTENVPTIITSGEKLKEVLDKTFEETIEHSIPSYLSGSDRAASIR